MMESKLLNLEKDESMRYSITADEVIESKDWENVTIEGCIISNAAILDTFLFSSDIICSSFAKSRFINVNLAHSDICSSHITNTYFENVCFDTATMRDCEFKQCKFTKCSFEHIAMTHTKFTDCVFENININQSSSYLNEFYNSGFTNCCFKGNFFYSIFANCSLCRGFLSDKLRAFNAIISKESDYNDDEKDDVILYLKENFLFLNIEIYKLNAHTINFDTFVLESLIAISQLIKHNISIRLEQIEFIQKILMYSCSFCDLPPLTLYQGLNILDRIFEETIPGNISLQKSEQCLNQLKNTMYLEYVKKISLLPQIKTIDFSNTKSTIYKITYEEKPSIQLSEIINKILKSMNVNNIIAKQIKTQKGSYIEFIEFISEAKPIIQIILTLTTGVVVPIIVSKAKNKPIDNQHNNNIQITNSTNMVNSPTVINTYNINISSSDHFTSKAAYIASQILDERNFNASNGYSGYSKNNVKSVEIIDNLDVR